MALTAGRFRRCWEEKTTWSNRMKFRPCNFTWVLDFRSSDMLRPRYCRSANARMRTQNALLLSRNILRPTTLRDLVCVTMFVCLLSLTWGKMAKLKKCKLVTLTSFARYATCSCRKIDHHRTSLFSICPFPGPRPRWWVRFTDFSKGFG